jgi:hypothetical protein
MLTVSVALAISGDALSHGFTGQFRSGSHTSDCEFKRGKPILIAISDILRTPSDYDRNRVAVSGTIKEVKLRSTPNTKPSRFSTWPLFMVLAWGHGHYKKDSF